MYQIVQFIVLMFKALDFDITIQLLIILSGGGGGNAGHLGFLPPSNFKSSHNPLIKKNCSPHQITIFLLKLTFLVIFSENKFNFRYWNPGALLTSGSLSKLGFPLRRLCEQLMYV